MLLISADGWLSVASVFLFLKFYFGGGFCFSFSTLVGGMSFGFFLLFLSFHLTKSKGDESWLAEVVASALLFLTDLSSGLHVADFLGLTLLG